MVFATDFLQTAVNATWGSSLDWLHLCLFNFRWGGMASILCLLKLLIFNLNIVLI